MTKRSLPKWIFEIAYPDIEEARTANKTLLGLLYQFAAKRNRMIRQIESPKSIEVHFVQNEIDPTGLGEPLFPPIFGAVANALYKATNKRYYEQPFMGEVDEKVERG
ncbi:MAG: hypothetical protein WBB12_09080 [Saprospiraceae bacterium]|jgi:hypothetical protein